jgi:hypothetical protein
VADAWLLFALHLALVFEHGLTIVGFEFRTFVRRSAGDIQPARFRNAERVFRVDLTTRRARTVAGAFAACGAERPIISRDAPLRPHLGAVGIIGTLFTEAEQGRDALPGAVLLIELVANARSFAGDFIFPADDANLADLCGTFDAHAGIARFR